MSTWQLLCNRELYSNTDAESIDEIIDTVNLRTNKYEEAHTYFRLRKNLDKKAFDNIFILYESPGSNQVDGLPLAASQKYHDKECNKVLSKMCF